MLACRLDHENVVKVFRVYGVEQRHAIIIMEYVGSKNLHHLLVERREKFLGRDWLLGVAIQASLLSSLPSVDSQIPGDQSLGPLPQEGSLALGCEASQRVGVQERRLQAWRLWMLYRYIQKADVLGEQGISGGHPWIPST